MDASLLTIISSVAWEAIKEGTKVLSETIKAKLEARKKAISDEDSIQISKITNNIPECYRLNEKLVEGYLQTNSQLISIIEHISSENRQSVTQNSYGSGDNVAGDKIVYGNK